MPSTPRYRAARNRWLTLNACRPCKGLKTGGDWNDALARRCHGRQIRRGQEADAVGLDERGGGTAPRRSSAPAGRAGEMVQGDGVRHLALYVARESGGSVGIGIRQDIDTERRYCNIDKTMVGMIIDG